MVIDEVITTALRPLLGNRVWNMRTPDDLPRDANGDILPFAIYALSGGTFEDYVDGERAELQHARVTIHYFATGSLQAGQIQRQGRELLRASPYTVQVYGSPVDGSDEARKLYSRTQQYGIYFPES